MEKPLIKIILTDDHPLIREGIARLIDARDNMEITGLYNSGQALLNALAQQPLPDILLLDISFPDTTGNELVRVIHKQYPGIKVIALTNIDAPYQVKDMIQHGCSGYLLKTTEPDVIIEAIESVYNGEQYLAPGLKEQLLDTMFTGSKPKTKELSNRELQILTLICNGKKNADIAKQLFLSLRTIENYRFALYEKFGVNNTAGLVKAALQLGLVQ
jgi:DNA-binding NarL/FixJ family response regulator